MLFFCTLMAVLMREHRVNNAAWSTNEADMAFWAPTVAVNDIAVARRKERNCCKVLRFLSPRFRSFALSACSALGKIILRGLQSRFHPI